MSVMSTVFTGLAFAAPAADAIRVRGAESAKQDGVLARQLEQFVSEERDTAFMNETEMKSEDLVPESTKETPLQVSFTYKPTSTDDKHEFTMKVDSALFEFEFEKGKDVVIKFGSKDVQVDQGTSNAIKDVVKDYVEFVVKGDACSFEASCEQNAEGNLVLTMYKRQFKVDLSSGKITLPVQTSLIQSAEEPSKTIVPKSTEETPLQVKFERTNTAENLFEFNMVVGGGEPIVFKCDLKNRKVDITRISEDISCDPPTKDAILRVVGQYKPEHVFEGFCEYDENDVLTLTILGHQFRCDLDNKKIEVVTME